MVDERGPAGGAATRRPEATGDRGGRLGLAVGRTVPLAVTMVLAAGPLVAPLPLPATELPIGLLIVVGVQLLGLLLAREMELAVWRRVWLTLLITTTIVLPVLGLQAAAARTPFTSLRGGSAGFALATTLVALVVVAGAMMVTAVVAAEAPDQASLLFLPTALLVPAMLAAPVGLAERTALAVLAETAGVAAVAAGVGWLLPPRVRPMVAPIALVVQLAVLWGLGFRPVVPPGGGAIVPILAALLIALTALATVFVPIAALIVRRFGQAMRDDDHAGPEREAPAPAPRRAGPGSRR